MLHNIKSTLANRQNDFLLVLGNCNSNTTKDEYHLSVCPVTFNTEKMTGDTILVTFRSPNECPLGIFRSTVTLRGKGAHKLVHVNGQFKKVQIGFNLI